MDKASAEKTIKDFIRRLGISELALGPMPKEEEDTCASEDFVFGFELRDELLGHSVFIAYDRLSLPQGAWSEEVAPRGWAAWHHVNVPGTRDTPPDVDTVSVESERLYGVMKPAMDVVMERRLEYAHQAFGEDDET